MRECQLCHCGDRAELSGEDCNCGQTGQLFGHTSDCRAIHHFVVADIVVVRNQAEFDDRRLTRKGYSFLMFHGKPVGHRMICRKCVVKESEAAARRRDYEKRCADARGSQSKTIYQIYCAG